jgi:ATP-dependent helicase/DNAse subunit B
MQISGQIDRVDIARDETLVAYDYKLSTGASMEDILAGRNLQLPIYLEALEQLFFPEKPVAGGGFYILRAGTDRRNKGMYRKDFKKDYLGIAARKSILSEAEWSEFRLQVKERIWNFLDRMREGGFTVEPSKGKETCKFCDYVAVCRYERYRIDRKRARTTDH